MRLWLIRETVLARRYSKVPPERQPEESDMVWVPKSIVEHTTKRGNEHDVKLPDWFIEKNNL
jgi:hypothetical protein